MKLLLDTHVFLWFINGDSHLPESTVAAIRNPNNQAYLSAVSFWEIAVKYQLGKLPLPDSPDIFVPAYCNLHHIQPLTLEPGCITELLTLPNHHRDPFDRMLVSQALHHQMVLVSEDTLVRSYPVSLL
jgi:PIN domain nuclease of toxin-antitoxin system